MAALLFHKRKNFLYIILFFASLIAVYLWNVPRAGFSEDHAAYFDGREKGSAGSVFDLPVHIVTGQVVPAAPAKVPSSAFTLPSNSTCSADTVLCDKIRFIGRFSEEDKRKYQSLIIKQIKSIDALLVTDTKIRDVLYSITLDASKGSRRGRAGSATIMIHLGSIASQSELIEILTHELGHIVDLGILKGNRRVVQNQFYNIDNTFFSLNDPSIGFYTISRLSNKTRSHNASAMEFVGGYAMSDPFEDFAESFNMYLNHHNVFMVLAANDQILAEKYGYMQQLFRKRYLKSDIATASHMKDNLDTRPWDTTKGY